MTIHTESENEDTYKSEQSLSEFRGREITRLESILEKLVSELHDASQVSGRDNMIRVAPLLEIIGNTVQCPDCTEHSKNMATSSEYQKNS